MQTTSIPIMCPCQTTAVSLDENVDAFVFMHNEQLQQAADDLSLAYRLKQGKTSNTTKTLLSEFSAGSV